MAAESYDYYLRFLKLPREASEQDIRAAITKETRVWARQASNGPTVDARHQAERRMETLDAAEKVLLGPEGRILRSRLVRKDDAEAEWDASVSADTVARAIQRVTLARGNKAQERRGTVVLRRSSIFYRGIDYICEELVHKRYEAAQDRTCCVARKGELPLFEWFCDTGIGDAQGKTGFYLPGPWVGDLVAFAADCSGGASG